MAELTQCPSCQRKLQVPETLMGADVQCPSCGATFKAEMPRQAGYSPAAPPPVDYGRPEDRYDRPPGRYDAPPPAYRDDYGRYGGRRDFVPHRGGMILTFGILSFVVCPLVFGLMAITMGNSDLAEMRAGRMDPEGEGMTNAGRICGIISLIMNVVCCIFYAFIIAANPQNFR